MSDNTEDTQPDGYLDLNKFELPEDTEENDGDIIRWILSCRNESKLAKWNRIQQTRENYDIFWGRHDFSHKLPGQSRETLAMQPMAVEQTAAYFQQSLVAMGDSWWRAEARNPMNKDKLKIDPETIQTITEAQFKRADLLRHIGLGLKSGLLGGLIITKLNGCWYDVPTYVASRSLFGKKTRLKKLDKKAWKLELSLVSQFNFYPDPTGAGLYEIEDMWVDYHEIVAQASGEDAIYDLEMVEKVERRMDDDADEKFDKMRRTNENEVSHSFRGRVKLTELWGKILDTDGNVLHDNCVATLANDRWLIRKPTPNPLWNQQSPFVTAPLLDSPDATWPKALADAGTKYNIAANELFNLMLDGAMRSVNGVNQIHQDWLEDPAQVEGGIKPGTNLGVNSQCPPGGKVVENVMTGSVPADSLQLYNLVNQEFNRAMLTSDIRQGMQPRQDVPATQIVEASQTINSVFRGIANNIETLWTQRILEKGSDMCMQFSDHMDEEEIKNLLEPDDAQKFLNLSAEERFAETVQGIHYNVFGLSLTMQKNQDYKKFMTLMQTIGASEPMIEAFVKKYSFDELLAFAMRAIGIPVKQLEIPKEQQELMQQQAQQQAQAGPGGAGSPPGGSAQPGGQPPGPAAPGGQPNQMSQTPAPGGAPMPGQGPGAQLQPQPTGAQS